MNGERKRDKNNPGLIDSVFRILFEVLWLAPYDRRRANPLMTEFGRCAQEAARLLSTTNFETAAREQVQAVVRSTERLYESVRRIDAARIFDSRRSADALAEAGRIADAVKNVCIGALPQPVPDAGE